MMVARVCCMSQSLDLWGASFSQWHSRQDWCLACHCAGAWARWDWHQKGHPPMTLAWVLYVIIFGAVKPPVHWSSCSICTILPRPNLACWFAHCRCSPHGVVRLSPAHQLCLPVVTCITACIQYYGAFWLTNRAALFRPCDLTEASLLLWKRWPAQHLVMPLPVSTNSRVDLCKDHADWLLYSTCHSVLRRWGSLDMESVPVVLYKVPQPV